ncbi:MAG: hypothetical protein II208_02325, partial [Alphaproteobacteria bacterium]|nr:hypothetical protein [Alphaproteobacteria bacterium]
AKKQGVLTAGSNITIGTDGTISAKDTTYSTGTTSTSGLTKLYTSTGTSTDGTMTQNAITNALSGKQDESTAVTHTENTAVGGTLKPVYVKSNGAVAAVTGISVPEKNSSGALTGTWAEIWIQ